MASRQSSLKTCCAESQHNPTDTAYTPPWEAEPTGSGCFTYRTRTKRARIIERSKKKPEGFAKPFGFEDSLPSISNEIEARPIERMGAVAGLAGKELPLGVG